VITKEYPVIWLQGAGCTGCSVSVLNAVSPKIQEPAEPILGCNEL